MREDLDTLIHTIARVSPHIAVKKDAWKYDGIQEMKNLKKRIDTISSDLSYYLLLEQAFTLSQDMHTSSWFPLPDWAKAEEAAFRRIRSRFKMAIPNTYVNGKYIIREAFAYEQDTIGIGSEIRQIEGIPVDKYVRQHISGRYYSYDMKHGKFYGAGFFKNTETVFYDSLSFTFRLPSGAIKNLRMSTREFTRYLPVGYKRKNNITRIELWEPEKVLYIRLTEMNADSIPFLQRELARYKEHTKDIERIIVDFRGNPGGDDTTWQALYSAIIPSPVSYPLKLSANKGFGKKKETLPLLTKYGLYALVDETETLGPSDSSLHFTGKIFVLFEDHYSSAGSAMIIPNAKKDDQIISVGRRTGTFLGVGFAPLFFTLPHSRIPYRIAPSIETTGAIRAGDLMHDDPEIEVPYDIRDFEATATYTGDLNDKAYLLRYDPFIRIAMQH
ncbi:Peptidase family S41 [Chitinophaga niabensis]|uniref:Peptidase family S41 n=2 Tax=Chitinophaga niabensis TaxID=536979 RepID=A0A1N6KBU1_9BACT|nr:Peptidase family S41 [Chitinophaga niabensis]